MGHATPRGKEGGATPMLAQYLALKAEAGSALLLFRLGDFYELFFGDAEVAAGALGITLTRRGTHAGAPVPMCGVPVQAHETYLARLVAAGHAVAIAEQLERDEPPRGRGLAPRAIVRVVTAGTLVEERLLEGPQARGLMALEPGGGWALADVSTGRLLLGHAGDEPLADLVARLAPAELVWPSGAALPPGVEARQLALMDRSRFDADAAARMLAQRHAVATVDGFGAFAPGALAATGGLFAHLAATWRQAVPPLAPPEPAGESGLIIDRWSRDSLELTPRAGMDRADTLIGLIDDTVTAAGGRLLARELHSPLVDTQVLDRRLDAVAWAMAEPGLAASARRSLTRLPDLERALQRLALGRGRAAALAQVARAVGVAAELVELFTGAAAPPGVDGLVALRQLPAPLGALLGPAFAEDGALNAQHAPGLGEARTGVEAARGALAALEPPLRAAAACPRLRLRHNQALGWYAEVPENAGAGVSGRGFRHRQTMAGTMRFHHPDLDEAASRLALAEEALAGAEEAALDRMTQTVLEERPALAALAGACARLDRTLALAGLARRHGWTRPAWAPGRVFEVTGGRHPVVEAALARAGARFVPNDARMDAPLWLVTGPNMGGKSTFLRQSALILVMAQMGSFVPAAAARLSPADRLFSRVGAADDLARGRSTFMVEMVETAQILHRATPASFVLLDEVGRGTSTWDGLALAWAVVEDLAQRGCRTLFATHYHELAVLGRRLGGVALRSLGVADGPRGPVFLHEVRDGPAPGSFGLHVASEAGVPAAVVARARALLARLEVQGAALASAVDAIDLPLFRAADPPAAPPPAPVPHPLVARLAAADPDALSPREAWMLVAALVDEARTRVRVATQQQPDPGA